MWVLALAGAGVAHAAAGQTFADRVELLDWADPERAAELVDAVPTPAEARVPEDQMLEMRGMVYTDMHRDQDVDATIARLDAMARQGNRQAVEAEHFVRAYSLYERDQYSAASAELSHIDVESIESATERYRVSILRGNILRTLGQAEAALPYLERALDLAHELHDDTRTLQAMLSLVRIYTNTGNLDRASAQLESARSLALMLGDEAALVEVEGRISDVADTRGDRAEERRASLAALAHARRSGSSKWLAQALINLGDSYLKTRDFAESLKYSREAQPLVSKLHISGDRSILEFNEGLAYIGLGSNVGDSEGAIDRACAALAALGTLRARSSLYRTKAWGVTEQPDFINAAVALETALEPLALLAALKAIEADLGRVATYRWGPRAIDLDILTYGDRRIREPDLVVPHARLDERAFALAPLAEIDPAFVAAYAALPEAARAEVRRVDSKTPFCELGRDA